jgi:hypothetical protein
MKIRIFPALLVFLVAVQYDCMEGLKAQACKVQLLVGYTAEAAEEAGGEDSLILAIYDAVDELNITFINSSVMQQAQLVRTFRVPFQENYCHALDLDSFAANPQVNALRDSYHADLAILIVDNDEQCGSYLPPDTVATGSTAFCTVNFECMKVNLSLSHFIAHLYGCGHLASSPGTEDTPYPYGHGYNWIWSDCANFLTIMGVDDYTNCVALGDMYPNNCYLIPYFSNPDVTYNNVPTGDARYANNARVLNDNSLTMAALRLFPPQYSISDSVTGYDYGLEIALDTLRTGSVYLAKDHSKVFFQAGARVELNPGTLLDEGSTFVAETKSQLSNCGNHP